MEMVQIKLCSLFADSFHTIGHNGTISIVAIPYSRQCDGQHIVEYYSSYSLGMHSKNHGIIWEFYSNGGPPLPPSLPLFWEPHVKK